MKTRTRLLAILLSLLLLLGALPPAVFAAAPADESAAVPNEAAQSAKEAENLPNPFKIELPKLRLPRSSGRVKAPRRNGEAPAAIDFSWDEATQTLSFSGVGAMQDFALGENDAETLPETPWSAYYDKAKQVVIGEGITHIGAVSFTAFDALETVSLPSTLTSIGDYAFAYCLNLASADLPSGLLEIGESAFALNRLSNVIIPSGVKALSGCYFQNFAKLSIALPEGLQTIMNCFDGTVVESLTIPSSVTSFGSEEDSEGPHILNVKNLTNLSAEAAVTPYLKSISDDDEAIAARFAIYKCSFAAEVNYLRTGEYPQDESFMLPAYNEILGTNYETWDAMMTAYENGEIPEEIIVAMESAMNEVGAPLGTIKIYCLSESAEHEALRVTGYLHYIIDQGNALCTEPFTAKCGDNMTWTVENSVLTITGYGEMYDNYNAWMFYQDEINSIRFVNNGGQISKISSGAFRNLGTLSSIEMPAGSVSCGWDWIENCTVGNLILPADFAYSNLDYIYYLFYGSEIETVTVDPANEFYFIENGALYTKGDDSVFAYYFGDGTDVVIKDGTARINDYAVYRNEKVTFVTIPASVVSIGQNWTFEGCKNLKRVILAQRTDPLDISAGTFYRCDALEEYVVSENDAVFAEVDGVLYSKDMTKVFAVPATMTELILPASVASIGDPYGQKADNFRVGLEKLTVENPDFDFGNTSEGNTSAFATAQDASTVTVTGHTGSTAEAFALRYGFRFVSLEGITVESVVFDLSGVPTTVAIGDEASFRDWGITGVVTYSDGTTKTIRYADVSGNDFNIQYKYPRETGWSENNWISFDYLGNYEFKIVYGEFVEPFTITVTEPNYSFEFDTSEAITEVKQYSPSSNYQQTRWIQIDEHSSTSVTDSILGVKLYKVYDDGETEQELADLGSNTNITYGDNYSYWGELVNEELGTYTVTFTKRDRNGNTVAETSIDVQVVAGDYSFSVDTSAVPATVTQFDEFNTGNWSLQATLRLDDGTEYDISDKVTFYDVAHENALDTSVPGEKTINPYLWISNYYEKANGQYVYVTIGKSLDPITVTILPDETIDSIRIEAPAELNLEKNHEYDLTDYVNIYVTRNGVEQQIEDENDIQFAGRDVSGGGTYGGKLCYLYNYGESRIYTVSYAGESVQMKIRCKQLYTYKVVVNENIVIERADRNVTAADLGLIVGWFNPDGITTDITNEVTFSGNTNLSSVGEHTVTLQFFENKEINLGWRTVGTVTFQVVCGSHDLSFVEAVPPVDCEHAGTIAHYVCTACGKTFNDAAGTEEITDLTGAYGAHTFGEWIDEIAATCVDTGVKGHYICSVCEKNFDADKNELSDLAIAIDPANHVGTDETVGAKEVTCKEDGYTGDIICSACRKVKTAGTVISKATASHAAQKTDAKSATCEKDGNIEYYTCTVCGKLFKDAACTQETNANAVKIAAKGHAYGEWTTVRKATCTQEGQEQRVCANDSSHKETRPIAKTAHEDDGNGYCKNCGADLNAGNRCKCGQVHTGPFAWLIKFFHSIQYFFKNLFK
ncbi:MAG: leucine-rich repeat protein [Clostridia bacterium]|nr:leucine-rich repeat protein [Clostridia bacterium]